MSHIQHQASKAADGEADGDADGEVDLGVEDASPDCANYATQEEAQEAYDAGEEGTFDLDQDFDGIVCEDFFGAEATPDAGIRIITEEPTDAVAQTDYSAIRAFAMVGYDEGGMRRSSAILYIEEE